MGDELSITSHLIGRLVVNAKLRKLLDGLPTLLSEGNVVLGIQNRAAEIGIVVDKSFVRARLDRWHAALDGVRAGIQALEDTAKSRAS